MVAQRFEEKGARRARVPATNPRGFHSLRGALHSSYPLRPPRGTPRGRPGESRARSYSPRRVRLGGWAESQSSGKVACHGAGGRSGQRGGRKDSTAAQRQCWERPPGCPRPVAAGHPLYFKSPQPPKGALRLAALLAVCAVLAAATAARFPLGCGGAALMPPVGGSRSSNIKQTTRSLSRQSAPRGGQAVCG